MCAPLWSSTKISKNRVFRLSEFKFLLRIFCLTFCKISCVSDGEDQRGRNYLRRLHTHTIHIHVYRLKSHLRRWAIRSQMCNTDAPDTLKFAIESGSIYHGSFTKEFDCACVSNVRSWVVRVGSSTAGLCNHRAARCVVILCGWKDPSCER
jgi:hypothetical protein